VLAHFLEAQCFWIGLSVFFEDFFERVLLIWIVIEAAITEIPDQLCEFFVKVVFVVGWVNNKKHDSFLLFGLEFRENFRHLPSHDEAVSLWDSKYGSLEPQLFWDLNNPCLVIDFVYWIIAYFVIGHLSFALVWKERPSVLFLSN